jgi:5-methylcytosine-specific restriction endonuclease McrA
MRRRITPVRQRRKTEMGDGETDTPARRRAEIDAAARRRGRYIPAAERREVYQPDAGRCTYVDARGERCCETRYLELHHLHPFAKQGANVASNLALRCTAHNALAAEEDFGPVLMAERRDATRHEALAAQPQ